MSHRFLICQVNKKLNSTYQTYNSYGAVSVAFKEGSNLINPTIILKVGYGLNYFNNKNYMIWQMDVSNVFRYWITNVKALNNQIYEISLDLDHLATYKTEIGNYNGYIIRCDNSNYYNKREFDNIVKPTTEVLNHKQVNLSSGFSTSHTTTVISPNGIRAQFFASRYSPQAIANHALDDSDIIDMIELNMGRCNDYFNLSKVYPFRWASLEEYPDDTGFVGTKETVIKGGLEIDLQDFSGTNGTTGTPAKVTRLFMNTIELRTSDLSFQNGYNDYRHYSTNFTRIIANCPFVGMVNIDPIYLTCEQINFKYTVDLITGVGQLSIYASYGSSLFQIGTYDFQCGFDVPITNYLTNYVQIATDIYNENATGIISDIFNPPTLKSSLSKASGFASHVIGTLRVDFLEYDSESFELENIKGFTTNKRANISSVGGYIECLNPSVAIEGCQQEIINRINSDLGNGFYYE